MLSVKIISKEDKRVGSCNFSLPASDVSIVHELKCEFRDQREIITGVLHDEDLPVLFKYSSEYLVFVAEPLSRSVSMLGDDFILRNVVVDYLNPDLTIDDIDVDADICDIKIKWEVLSWIVNLE